MDNKKRFYSETMNAARKAAADKLRATYAPPPPPPPAPEAPAPEAPPANPLEGVDLAHLTAYLARIQKAKAETAGAEQIVQGKDPEILDRLHNAHLERKMQEYEEETGGRSPKRGKPELDEEE